MARHGGWALLVLVFFTACALEHEPEPGEVGRTGGAITLAPGWVTGTNWPTETVVALNSVALRSSSWVVGDVGVIRAGNGAFLGGNAELSIASNAEVTGDVRADSIDLQVAGHVGGRASYNQLVGLGTIDGTRTPSLSLPLGITIVTTSNFSQGATSVTVNAGSTVTRSAGNYSAFNLSAGSRSSRAILRLNSGTYNVGSVTLSAWSRLECRGACTIRVKNRVIAGPNTYLGPGGGSNQTMDQVKLFVEGTNGTQLPLGVPAAAAFGQQSELKAFTFVPNGTLSVGPSATCVGKFIALDVDVLSDTELVNGSSAQAVLTATPYIEGASWPNEVVTALNSLDFQSGTQLSGDVAVLQNGTGLLLSSSEAVLGTNARVTGNLRADKIELKSGARITGVATYNTLSNAGTIGSLSTPLPLPLETRVPVFPVITSGSTNHRVGARQEQTLAAGRYRDLNLDAGVSGDPTILTLSGGVYEFRNLTLGAHSQLLCSAACEVRVRSRVTTGDNAMIGPSGSLDMSNVRLFVNGDTGFLWPGFPPIAVNFGTNNTIQAFVFAPRGTLDIKSGTTIRGRFIGRDVRLGSNAVSQRAGSTELAPTIQQQPQSLTITAGQSATFSVTATGTDVSFQWKRGGVAIPGATGGSYTLTNAALSDSGATFTVTVSNAVGSVTSSPATLTVNVCSAETFPPMATTCGVGACARTGMRTCVSGRLVDSCTPGAPAASDATCNNIDDDCNGVADEDYVPTTTTCAVGACAATGLKTCVAGVVTDSCVSSMPAPNDATCDGRDDDCDGRFDENFTPFATVCGVGACARTGVTTCVGGVATDSCNPGEPGASDADCDGVDDDCDGEPDQDYESVDTSCGVGACRASGQTDCVAGRVVDSCRAGTHAANDATCDGVDDDCDSKFDENFPTAATSCGVGACVSSGTASCVSGAIKNTCRPGTPAPSDVSCDGVDDNCDGSADEGYVSQPTSCGLGACAATGATSCVSGSVRDNCTPGAPLSMLDTTCNGIDDNCNGLMDEGYISVATSCGIGACVASGATRCVLGGVEDDCVPGAPAPNDATCNGVDDNCNGVNDEDYVSVATSCGSGSCSASGLTSCSAGNVLDSCVVPTADADQDGAPDCSDGCPSHAAKTAPGVCGCSVPDVDSDGDGVLDCLDACPDDAANDADGDGLCSDVDVCPLDAANDGDADGLCADADNCATVFNPDQADSDHDGLGDVCDMAAPRAVAAGGEHSCALLQNGTVSCWGEGSDGQLGDGRSLGAGEPVLVAGLADATEVVCGYHHTCALRASGSVVCWGANGSGQLGTGNSTAAATPVEVSGVSDAVHLSAGREHTCALRANGAVLCWGGNESGQLGNDTLVASTLPVAVTGLANVTSIASGYSHNCALGSDHSVRCWGANWYGQIGNNSLIDAKLPVLVSGLTDVAHIAAGDLHSCAALSGGGVKCWGANWYGQIGDGTWNDAKTPAVVSSLTDVVRVEAGELQSCALRGNGEVWCWGYNLDGQLADGTLQNRSTPVLSGGLHDATQLAVGDLHACALRTPGELVCWGLGEHGQLGHGKRAQTTKPQPVASVTSATQVALGSYHGCALTASGGVDCWGVGSDGALGDGALENSSEAVHVSGVTNAIAVTAGADHACALRSDHHVVCWGFGEYGELGQGSQTSSSAPVTVSGLSDASAIAAGDNHTCALRATGGVVCWGYGGDGELGQGSRTSASAPVAVSGITDASAIAAGGAHSCALLVDGRIVCWGDNNYGQLGDGSVVTALTPVAVSGMTDATSLSAGSSHTCAVVATGQVRCWGGNSRGQLGNGALLASSTPVAVALQASEHASSVAAGNTHTCARLTSGAVRCWGSNTQGECGDGTVSLPLSTPVAVATLADAVAIDAGYDASCAVRSNGEVRCWGAGDGGKLGNLYPWSSSPVRVSWPGDRQ